MGGITVDIINYINECSRSGMLFGVYIMVLVLLAFLHGKTELKYVQGVIYPGIVMFLGIVLAFPVFNNHVKFITGLEASPRLSWILTPTIVLALSFAYFVKRIDGNVKKMLAGIAICIAVFSCGEHMITPYVYKQPENMYKFPQSVVDITNAVTAKMDEPVICVPASSSYPFRQISTKVHLLFGEDATYGRIVGTDSIFFEVAEQMERSQPDLYFIMDVLRDYNVDYLVLDQTYMVFGGIDLNDEGYESSHVYIGDRTPIETPSDGVDHSAMLDAVRVNNIDGKDYWDLSDIGLDYVDTYGQYLLYRVNKD